MLGSRAKPTRVSQKAPSAKRCIKTSPQRAPRRGPDRCQKAPSAKRCIKTSQRAAGRWADAVRKHRAPKGALRHEGDECFAAHWSSVRKHRAPKGALRPEDLYFHLNVKEVRKHRAPKGALRLRLLSDFCSSVNTRQKAPSAKRCIKTTRRPSTLPNCGRMVRKHRAPKGALRQYVSSGRSVHSNYVRKHRAPKGALRLLFPFPTAYPDSRVRKHRAPKGALRHHRQAVLVERVGLSESTERQKVH